MCERIALFSPSMVGGGAERVMLNLARGFSERGMQVDLVLAQAVGPNLTAVPPQVRIVDLRAKRVLSSLPRLLRYLRQERPTGMVSSQSHANVIALWARRMSSLETRLVVREGKMAVREAGIRERLMLYFVRHSYKWADGIVANSKGVANDLAYSAGLARKCIQVIYNPVICSELMKKAEEPISHPWFQPGEPPIILGVGRLVWHKDFATLINAFARVRKKTSSRLMILGEGEKRAELEQQIGELNLTQYVSLPGFLDNPYAYMARAAVYVLSSVSEGLPNTLLEAMAVGTPVVATDCESGPCEILADGKYGHLTPVGDASTLATAISDVIEGREYLRPHQMWLKTFSLDACITKYLRLMRCSVNE